MSQNTSPDNVPSATKGTADSLAAPGRVGVGGTKKSASQSYQSEQARFLEKTRRNFEAVSKRHGPSHSWTKFWCQECKREAGYLISGVYCSGVSGWGRA
jgi:hypothetical protein